MKKTLSTRSLYVCNKQYYSALSASLRETMLIALIITVPLFLKAQDQDPKAKAILNEVSAKTKSYASIKAKFTYSMENKAENISESQKGELLLKGEKYRLELAGHEIICDGKTVWTYLKDAKEVQISEPEYDEGAINPVNIFTIYEEGFKYKYYKEEAQEGQRIQLINLYPVKAKEKSYHTIRVSINKNKKEVTGIIIFAKDGNIYSYKIKKFTTDLPVNDSDFTFKASDFPGVEVIDLR